MKIPKWCLDCPMDFNLFYCKAVTPWKIITDKTSTKIDDNGIHIPRPDWCPLVEIKTPHGRLFDETEIKKCLHELPDSEDKWGAIALLEWAIEKRWCIEAEGEG